MRFLNYTRAIYFFFLLLWFYTLVSCSAQKKLNNLLDRHPDLRKKEVIQIDTTIQVIASKDSLSIHLPIIEIHDTVHFQSKQLTVKVWKDNFDTIYIDAECDTFTVYVPFETTVEVEKIIYKKARDGLIWWVVLAVVILTIIIILKKLLS